VAQQRVGKIKFWSWDRIFGAVQSQFLGGKVQFRGGLSHAPCGLDGREVVHFREFDTSEESSLRAVRCPSVPNWYVHTKHHFGQSPHSVPWGDAAGSYREGHTGREVGAGRMRVDRWGIFATQTSRVFRA
jgi:hypothetical protein